MLEKMDKKIIGVFLTMLVTTNIVLLTLNVNAAITSSKQTCLELSPMNIYLGTFSEDEPEIVQFTFFVTNTGDGVLQWYIQNYSWWITDIVIDDGNCRSGSCKTGESVSFTIFVNTGNMEAIAPNVNVYPGFINISSNGGNVSATVNIGILRECKKSFNFNFDIINWLFERFPNAFKILRHIMNL